MRFHLKSINNSKDPETLPRITGTELIRLRNGNVSSSELSAFVSSQGITPVRNQADVED